MTTNTNPLALTTTEALRAFTSEARAGLSAAFLVAPLSHLEALRVWTASPAGGQHMGADSRAFFQAAVSAAVITTGERADACNPGTRTERAHLARMGAIDALTTALLTGAAA